ncbi:MAG: dTDP-4-dehydrorhamnose reductase [Candidatus Omnitrophica bacterium]|nr:dTDP-4-dehydrorhamnose reductase [Candidatus Omnitrophota bacterium]
MKILITGSTGLLGQALIKLLAQHPDVVGVSRHPALVPSLGRHRVCDLAEAEPTQRLLQAEQPALIIHAQALSNVDEAEQDPALARRMNVEATAHLARAIQQTDTVLLYVSTDYVFDGAKGRPYVESDAPHPISVYGRSKLEGEQAALRHSRAIVARPSTLFGAGRMNFCHQVAERLRAHQPVEAFRDQVTSPTFTDDLAAELIRLGEAAVARHEGFTPRIYHLANAGACSRLAFAQRIAALMGCDPTLVHAIPMAALQRPAPRPAYSALATEHETTGRSLRSWDEALIAYLRQQRWLN